jgi:hypothetical protein
MKKPSFPSYPPPIPSLADYYHASKVLQGTLETDNGDEVDTGQTPRYPPPVTSLADYYHADSPANKSQIAIPEKPKASKNVKKTPKTKKSKKKK